MSIYNDPKMIEMAQVYGKAFYQSGFFGVNSVEQGTVFAIEMIAANKTPFSMMQTYHVVGGTKVTKSASAMLAEFNERGGKHKVNRYDSEEVSIEFEYNGASVPVSISWQEAQQEKWPFKKDGKTLIQNWSTPLQRAAMLFARVTTRGIRAVCPEVNAGTYSPEEIAPEQSTPNQVTVEQIQSLNSDAGTSCKPAEDLVMQETLDQIRALLTTIYEWDDQVYARVRDVLKVMDKESIAHLTILESEELLSKLQQKQAAYVLENSPPKKEYVFGGEEG